MSISTININTSAVVRHTARLEKLHRSALPVAVRQTLSKAAFDVKMRTMPAQADKNFEKREPNFFKANSKVTPAKGFDMKSMVATVGFIPLKGTNKAVDDLKQQEDGGNIGGRTFIALRDARVSGSWRKKPRARMRLADIDNKIIDSKKGKGKNSRERFTRSALHAGKGGFVLGEKKTSGGSRILFEIRSVVRKKGNTVVKSKPIYAVKSGRVVKPAATHFMRKASLQSAKGMEIMYIAEANKQIAKYK